jgi:PAS domain S-box-containing protein
MTLETRLLQQAIDALDDVFYVYDAAGRLVVWNERLNELFDRSDDELAGMTPPEFFVESDRDAVSEAVGEVFTEGETVVEATANTTAGRIQFELVGKRLRDDDGTVLGFCGTARDVTDHRDRERKLAAQNDRLSEFASILAHDLRNPVAVAHGYLEQYEDTADPDALAEVDASLDRIEAIIQDVLAIARAGQAATDLEPVSLDAVASAAWRTVDTGDARLEVDTAATVQADPSRLQRLFENLFRNAVEHGSATADGGSDDDAVTVTVADTERGFVVADDGPGIPPADRVRVFDPGVSSSTDSTGFGLYVVRTVAEAHGWTVAAVDPGPDGGARFEFALVPDEHALVE